MHPPARTSLAEPAQHAIRDFVDPDRIGLSPFATDGRLLVVAVQHHGASQHWTAPTARGRHPRSDSTVVAPRILAAPRIEHADLSPALDAEPADCLTAVCTARAAWPDQRLVFVGSDVCQMHAIPRGHDEVTTHDLRPTLIKMLLTGTQAAAPAVAPIRLPSGPVAVPDRIVTGALR